MLYRSPTFARHQNIYSANLKFSMKNLFSTLVFATITLLVSCKKVDPALVAQMDERIEALGSKTEGYDMNTQGIVSFASLVDTAPEELKIDTASGFPALHKKVTALRVKQEGTVSEYREVLAELQKLSADYAAGKVPTDQVRSRFTELDTRLTNIDELLKQVGALNDEAQTEYGKMMAEYRSKTE